MSAAASFICRAAQAQVLRGHTGIVIPGREALLDRLASVAKKLDGTAFAFSEHNDYVEATCPGAIACAAMSRMPRASAASRSASPMSSSTCRPGPRKASARSIPRSWESPPSSKNGDGTVARAKVGKDQYLQFRETDRPQPDFDGHHVQIYITNFSGPYRRLRSAA